MLILTQGNVVFKNYNTPADIANAAPTLDYRFALDKTEIDAISLTDKLTFTRSASCAFTDAGGNLAIADANVPRFNHTTSKQSLGLFIEGSATNPVVRNTEFNVSPWTSSNVIVTPNAGLAPDGSMTADLLESTGSNGFVEQTRNYAVNINTVRTFSVYLRADTNVSLSIQVSLTEFFNFGQISTQSITANVTTQWQRFSQTYTVPGNQFGGNSRYVTPRIGGSSTFTTGEKVYAWGFQDESGSSASSFIATAGSSVTRTETATISLAGLPATRTLVEKPAGCANIAGDTLTLNTGYTIERVMVFPVSLSAEQITAIRNVL